MKKSTTKRRRPTATVAHIKRSLRDLRGLVESLESTGRPPAGTLVRTYTRANAPAIPQPRRFGPTDVKALRNRLGASQPIFAELVGVSLKLVGHWEQGIREPSPLACRLFELIERSPSAVTAPLRARRGA